MKAVLISIQPKWCEFIASGEKTVEVRKTKPKCEVPFKCYIYMTMGKCPKFVYNEKLEKQSIYEREPNTANGKVIGEFICDRITKYECSSVGFGELATTCGTCLTYDEILNYCNGNDLYGWHITDLVVYDEPRELREFCRNGECAKCGWFENGKCFKRVEQSRYNKHRIKRPPQSWMYVEVEE